MNTLLHFKNFYNEINSSNSRKYKQEVLQKHKDDEIVKRYLQIAFDPFRVYGISSKKLSKKVADDNHYLPATIFDLFKYLEQNNTGRDKDIAVCCDIIKTVASSDCEAAELLKVIICKDLSIGVDRKTINQVIPFLLPEFNVMLANKYFDKPEYVEGKDFAITTKIDGGRIIALKENGQVSFYTRAGQKYEGLVDLEREMLEKLPDGLCLDGEITILDNKGIPSKEAYKRAMKITRSDGEKHGLKMICFDCMLAEEFRAQRCDRVWEDRRQMLANVMAKAVGGLTYFEPLSVLYCGTDTSMITKLLDEAVANQEEGIMINIALAPYEFKRTNHLLKCKKMQTVDLEIVGFEEGTGRLVGTLGAILVRYKDGNIVKVGSGFSDAIRTLIWIEPSDFLGKIVEISYFEETTNASGGVSLRFPIFKDFRPDKTEAEF